MSLRQKGNQDLGRDLEISATRPGAGRTRSGNLVYGLWHRLETAGYVSIEKTFSGKIPRTIGRLTDEGRHALDSYRQQMGAVIGSE